MKSSPSFGVLLAGCLASLSAACNHDVGPDTCAVPIRTDAPTAGLDPAAYFSPEFYRDPKATGLALSLRELGGEPLYARRVEPDLVIYRLHVRGLHISEPINWNAVLRAEGPGPNAWAERRRHYFCKRRSDGVYWDDPKITKSELPIAVWLAMESCMDRSFWTVPMDDGERPPEPAQVDGSACLVEGVRGGEYRVLERNCRNAKGEVPAFVACFASLEKATR